MFFAMLISLIPYFLLAYQLVRRSVPIDNFWANLSIVPAFGAGLIVFLVGSVGRICQSFTMACFIGSGLCLIGALVLFFTGSSKQVSYRFPFKPRDLPLLILVLVSLILVSIIAFRYSIYDEIRIQAHLPVVEAILRGRFPPGFTAFPDIPLRYHYGFNILAAYFSRAFSVPGYFGVDIASIFCWFSFVSIFFTLLKLMGVQREGWSLAFALVAFTGGLSWLISKNDVGMGAIYQIPHWQQMFVMHRGVHPQFMMYFFQHPMGFGISVFLGVILFFKEWFESKQGWALISGLLLLVALSLIQVMLFVTLLASIGVVFGYYSLFASQGKPRFFIIGGFVGLFALLGAFLLGGFFQISPNLENQPLIISWPPSYLRYEFWGNKNPLNIYQAWIWYLSGFGVFIFAIPIAWYFAFRKKAAAYSLLAAFSIISFLVPLFFRYRYSWDIIKWYFGFEYSGKLLIACLIFPWVLRSWPRYILAVSIVCFSAITPLRFLTELALKPISSFSRPELRISGYGQLKSSGALGKAVNKIINSPDNWGYLWGSADTSLKITLLTGMPTLQMDQNTYAMPISRDRITARAQVIKELEERPDIKLLHENQVKWMVFTCSEFQRKPPEWKANIKVLEALPEIDDLSFDSGREGCYRIYRIWSSVAERRNALIKPDF